MPFDYNPGMHIHTGIVIMKKKLLLFVIVFAHLLAQEEQQPAAAPAESAAPPTVDLALTEDDTISLDIDPTTPDQYVADIIPPQKKSLDIGPLHITKGTMKLTPDQHLILTAVGTLFDRDVEIGLIDAQIVSTLVAQTPPPSAYKKVPRQEKPLGTPPPRPAATPFPTSAQQPTMGTPSYFQQTGLGTPKLTMSNAIWGIKFLKPYTYTPIPGKPVSFNSLEIIYDPWRPLLITGTSTILGKTAKFNFEVDKITKKLTTIGVLIPDLMLAEIMPEAKKTPKLENIILYDTNIQFSLDTKTTTISGFSEILEHDVDVFIVIDSKEFFSFEGTVKIPKPIKPFEKIGIPELEKITFRGTGFELERFENLVDLIFFGNLSLFGTDFRAKMRTKHDSSGKRPSITIFEIIFPHDWELAQAVREFRGSIFDKLDITELGALISSGEFMDYMRNISIRPGITFFGRLPLKGTLEPAAKLTFTPPTARLLAYLQLAKNPLESMMRIPIPTNIKLGRSAKIENLVIELIGKPVSFSLLGMTQIHIGKTTGPQYFTTRISLSPTSALLAGTMFGVWHDALGIKGFDMKNAAIQAGIDFKLLATTGIPIDTFGLTGTFDFADHEISVAGNFSVTKSDQLVVRGAINKLMLADLITVAQKILSASGDIPIEQIPDSAFKDKFIAKKDVVAALQKVKDIKIPIDKIPDIGLKDAEIYMASSNVRIGEIMFLQGMTVKGTIIIPGFTARGSLYLSPLGWIGEAYFSEIKLGPVLITGDGPDKKLGTKDDGATLNIEITRFNQEVFASAIIKLESIFELSTKLLFSRTEISFLGEAKISKQFLATIEGRAALIHDPDLYLKFYFKNDLFDYIEKEVDKQLSKFQKQAKKKLTQAQSEVAKLNKQLKEIDNKLAKKQNDLKKVADQKNYKDLESLRKEVIKWQRKWNKLSAIEKPLRVDISVPLASAKTAYETAKAAIKIGSATKIEGEIFALATQHAAIASAKETADKTLEGLKAIAHYGIGEGGKLVTKALLNIVDIKQATVEGYAKELVKGKLPSMSMDFTLFGTEHHLEKVQFDLTNPEKSSLDIAHKLADMAMGQ